MGFYTSPILRPYIIETAYDKDLIPEYQNSVINREDTPFEWPIRWKMVAKSLKLLHAKKKLNFGVVRRSRKKYLLKVDPSEGIRSAEIIPLSKKYFPDIEIRPFGGGILQHALDVNFYANFNKNNPNHVKCLELLCSIERHFMATKEIGAENAFLIGRIR